MSIIRATQRKASDSDNGLGRPWEGEAGASSPGRIIAGGNPEKRPSGRPCAEPEWHKPESPRSDSERVLGGPSEVEQALSRPQNQYTERRDTTRPAKEQELVRAAKFYKEETLQCKGVPPASERESIQSMKLTDSV